MLVGPADTLPPAPDPDDADFEAPPALAEAVAALEVAGNFMFDAATHRDFLGAVLGTGLDRAKACPCSRAAAAAAAEVCLSQHVECLNTLGRTQQRKVFDASSVTIVALQVGDILVLGDRGAQLLVAPQLADFLCEALTSVRSRHRCPLTGHPVEIV